MRIAHVSDLHIRNFKYRDEYRAAFGDLYRQLRLLRPDLIVNTGDTVHSKLSVSPELFEDVAVHFREMTEIAPYWVILGNHDLNLKNPDRMDAISPIVRAMQGKTKHELRIPEPTFEEKMLRGEFPEFSFWNFDIRGHDPFSPDPSQINVGLYHGSIAGCVSDLGQKLEGEELEKFDGMDYVLLGDIHKRQSFRGGRIAYPGSLIQQNYGEELVKGFLLWDIGGKGRFVRSFHPISAPSRFFTINVGQELDLSSISVPEGSRIRAIVDGELTPSKRFELEKAIREKFSPLEVIAPDASSAKAALESVEIDQLIGSRDPLMRDHLKDQGVSDEMQEKVIDLFKAYERDVSDDDVPARGTTWNLHSVSWDNMMNYGEGNFVKLKKLAGLVGIFAPNASGKSSIFDIFLEALFDKVPKDVPRNIDLVNDNKDEGKMAVEIESSGQRYKIERKIERIHYGQRKFSETKQWGKTSLDFYRGDTSLTGDGRPETERAIRKIIGSFEDFALTSMVTQNPVFGLPGGADIVNCKETDRRKILFRFLDLDLYERINSSAKDDLKELMGKLKGLDVDELKRSSDLLLEERKRLESDVLSSKETLSALEGEHAAVLRELERADFKNVLDLVRQRQEVQRRLESIRGKIDAGRKIATDMEQKLAALTSKRDSLLSRRPSAPAIPLDELARRISDIRSRKQISLVEASGLKSKLDQGVRSLKTLEGVPCEGKYPSCRFISEASSFMESRDSIERALASFQESGREIDSELTKLEDHEVVHREIGIWERELSQTELDISKAEGSLERATFKRQAEDAELGELASQLDSIETSLRAFSVDEVKSIREREESLRREVLAARASIDRLLKSAGAVDAKIDSVAQSIASLDGLKERTKEYEILVEMTGKAGLPYRILTMVLPAINYEIGKILSGIVKFNVFFENDPDDQSISLHIRYGDYKSRPLGLGSGAEKFIASLAIRVALLSVSSLPKTDVLIIDEGFGKLDPEHLESLQRMFEYLKGAFRTVFIVSHVDFMRDIVDHSVEISSRDGYAHVEVG